MIDLDALEELVKNPPSASLRPEPLLAVIRECRALRLQVEHLMLNALPPPPATGPVDVMELIADPATTPPLHTAIHPKATKKAKK